MTAPLPSSAAAASKVAGPLAAPRDDSLMLVLLTRFAAAVDAAARALFVLAGVLLSVMMLVITADVASRTLFGVSGGSIRLIVSGGVELVRYSLLFTIACALPAVVERGQVVVDSFTTRMPERAKQLLFAAYLLGFCGFGVLLAVGWYGGGLSALRYGEMTQDLSIPIAPLYFAAAACAVLLALRSLVCAVRAFAGREAA